VHLFGFYYNNIAIHLVYEDVSECPVAGTVQQMTNDSDLKQLERDNSHISASILEF
jgi:hypothetical protein